MNLVQLQLVFNHDNIDFITKGLNEFSAQILQDHEATEKFGYFGRAFDSIHNANYLFNKSYPTAAIGVLKSYLDSSPELVEVFMLWDLPNRDDDKNVCTAHTLVFSVIIYCTIESDNSIGRLIVFKLMDEYLDRITDQLSSGDYTLIHCTLGLILNMCRVSSSICNNVYQKLIVPCKSFAAQLQPGKLITVPFGDQKKIQTDTRYMIIMLLFTLLDSQDQSILVDFFDMNSLYRKALNGIYKDTSQTSMLILRGILRLMSPNSSLSIQNKLNLVDNNFLKKSLDLYSNEDEIIKSTAHELIVQYAQCISQGMQWSSKGKIAIQKISRGKAITLIRLLQPQLDIKHRLIQLELLRVQPSLLSYCVSTLSMANWDPKPSFPYVSTLSHLIHLIQSTGIDISKQLLLHSIVRGDKKEKDTEVKHCADTLIGDMIPSGLTKKEFSKILLHPNHMLQRLGMILMRSILSRIHSTISGKKTAKEDENVSMARLPRFTAYLHSAISTIIPDYQLLISLRGRYMKILLIESSSINASSNKKSSENNIITSNKNNRNDISTVQIGDSLVLQIEGQVNDESNNNNDAAVDKGKTTNAMATYLLSLLLSVLSEFIHTSPEIVSQSNFDPLKLIDDIVQWKSADPAEVALVDLGQYPDQVYLDSLNVLSVATRNRKVDQLCRWFGGKDSAVKMLQHLIVTSDNQWIFYKRSPLTKLMLLYLGHKSIAVKESSRCLLVEILHRSDLFESHGTEVVEMLAEIEAWVTSLRLSYSSRSNSSNNSRYDSANNINGNDFSATLFLAEVCLKIAFHWNTELCYLASTIFQNENTTKGYVYYGVSNKINYISDNNTQSILTLPFSPVLLASFCLYENYLGFLLEDMPKHIRSIISPTPTPLPIASNETMAMTSTAPDDGNRDTQDILEKNGFRSELLLFIEKVIISSVRGVRDRLEYIQCLSDVVKFLSPFPSFSDSKDYDQRIDNNSKLMSLMHSLQQLFIEDENVSGVSSSGNTGGRRKWIQDLMTGKKKIKNKTIPLFTSSMNNGVTSLVTAAGNIQMYIASYNNNNNNNNMIPITSDEQYYFHTHWDLIVDVYTRHYLRVPSDVTIEGVLNIVNFITTLASTSIINKRYDDGSWSWSLMQLIHVIQCVDRLLHCVSTPMLSVVNTDVHILYETLVHLYVVELAYHSNSDSSSSSVGISTNITTTTAATTISRQHYQLVVMSSLNVNFMRFGFLRDDALGNCLLKIVTAAITSFLHHRTASQHQYHINHNDFMIPLTTLCKSLVECIKTSYPSLSSTLTSCTPSFFLLTWVLNEIAPDHTLKSIIMSQLMEDLTTGESPFNVDMAVVTNTTSLGELWTLESITSHLLLSSSASTLMKLLLSDVTDASSSSSSQDRGDINYANSSSSRKLNQLTSGYVLQTRSSNNHVVTTKAISGSESLLLSFLYNPLQHMIKDILTSLQIASTSITSIIASGKLIAALVSFSNHHILLKLAITNIVSKIKVHGLDLYKILDIFRPYLTNCCKSDSSSMSSSFQEASESSHRILSLPFDAISSLQQLLYSQHSGLEDIRLLMENPMIRMDIKCYGHLMCNCLSTVNTPLFTVDFLPSLLTYSLPGLLLSNSNDCITSQAMDVDVEVGDEGEKVRCWIRVYQRTIWCLITSITMFITKSSNNDSLSSVASIYEQIKIDDDTIETYCLAGGELACDLPHLLNALARLFQLTIPTTVATTSSQSNPINSFESYLRKDAIDTKELISLKSKCNLFISILLEYAFTKNDSLESVAITDTIGDIMFSLVCPNELAVSSRVSYTLFSITVTDTCHPCKLLRTLLKYPGFSDTLQLQILPVGNELQMSMLRLLVRIMSLMVFLINIPLTCHHGTSSSNNTTTAPLTLTLVNSNDLSILVSHLMGIYSGTLSAKDKIVRRILELVYSTGCGPHYCTLLFTGGKDNDNGKGNEKPNHLSRRGDGNGATRSASDNWIEHVTTAPMVYSTLKEFPFDRSSVSSPLTEEGNIGCKNHIHAIHMENNSLRHGWGDELYLDDHQSRVTRKKTEDLSDTLELGMVYDPSYWLPVVYHNIREKDVSVRMIANSGLLSLMIASLGCHCIQMRTIALACLQRMFVLIRTQTSDVDATFKERPQLLLLLNFIRNSFDMKGIDKETLNEEKMEASTHSDFIPSLTPSIAIFLARAALHLLQPAHELYGKINKYLLSRPFCDQKDVPLFDLLVTDGQSSTESQERLAVLRLISDGLLSREDHLNMCRKNAYNRLMLLYPIYNKDYRAGHAVLDILDKAMQLKSASRYLLERCTILTWLQQMCAFTATSASPATKFKSLGDMKTTPRATETSESSVVELTSIATEDINQPMTDCDSITDEETMATFGDDQKEIVLEKAKRKIAAASSPCQTLHPPRSLIRYLALTRRCLRALCLLSGEGVDCKALMDRIRHILITVSQDILTTYDEIKHTRTPPHHTTVVGASVPIVSLGVNSEVSDEMLHQLILGLWEYLMIATYTSLLSSSTFPGFESTLLLDLCEVVTSRKSSDSNHMQLTLLLMLSFHTTTSCPPPLRLKGLDMEASNRIRIYTSIIDTTIRTFLLTSNLNEPAIHIARGRGRRTTATTTTTLSKNDTYHALVDPYCCSGGKTSFIDSTTWKQSQQQQQQQYSRSSTITYRQYISAVNIITGDVTVTADNHTYHKGNSVDADDDNSGGLDVLFDEHWNQLKTLDIDSSMTTTGLMSSLDVLSTLSVLIKVLLHTIYSHSFSMANHPITSLTTPTISPPPPPSTTTTTKIPYSDMLNIELVRWVILIHQSIHRFPPLSSSQEKSNNIRSRLRNRFLSSIDASPVDNYDDSFCNFQLQLRLTLLGCLGALVSQSFNMPCLQGMKKILLLTLSILHTTKPLDSQLINQIHDDDNDAVIQYIQTILNSSWQCDGHNLWEIRDMRLVFLDLFECVFSLLSFVVSHIDCHTLNGSDGVGDGIEIDNKGGGESSSISPSPAVVGSAPELIGSSALEQLLYYIEKHCEIISKDITYQSKLSTTTDMNEREHLEGGTHASFSCVLTANELCDWSIIESTTGTYDCHHRDSTLDIDIRENKLDCDMEVEFQQSLMTGAMNNIVNINVTNSNTEKEQFSILNKRSLIKGDLQSSDKKRLRKLIQVERRSAGSIKPKPTLRKLIIR